MTSSNVGTKEENTYWVGLTIFSFSSKLELEPDLQTGSGRLRTTHCESILILTIFPPLRRWVNVPAGGYQGSPALPQRPTSSLVEKSIPLDRQSSWPPLQSQPPVTPSPSATELNIDKLNRPATETLSVSREEVLKGVIIKGIVCGAPKHPRVKSPTGSSGSASNPFEKRAAPAPPTASQRGSESEPKTKAKNRSR